MLLEARGGESIILTAHGLLLIILYIAQVRVDNLTVYAYTDTVNQTLAKNDQTFRSILPCACANLRRASRAVTRMYNQELRKTGLEATQYTLLMGLDLTGETAQGELGTLLGLDSTTLTRMLGLLTKHRWIIIRPGKDRRERLVRLSVLGKDKLRQARAHWERAQKHLREGLGEDAWNQMAGLLGAITRASSQD